MAARIVRGVTGALALWLVAMGACAQTAQSRLLQLRHADRDRSYLLYRPENRARAEPAPLAPYAVGEPVPLIARVVGSAVLLPRGAVALTPAALLAGASGGLCLRNGLGQTVAATRDGMPDALGVQRLRLVAALPAPLAGVAVRPPFAGSPGYLLEYAPGDAAPAWPLIRLGFFGRMPATAGPRALGIEVPPGPRGGPVFEVPGRWAGLTSTDKYGKAQLIAAADLLPPAPTHDEIAPVAAQSADVRPGADEVYERGLRQALGCRRRGLCRLDWAMGRRQAAKRA